MRPLSLFRVLREEVKAATDGVHTPVMLWGAPGVGKSQIVHQVGVDLGIPIIDVRLSQMEPSDLRGIPFRQGDKVEWAVPSLLPDEDAHGDTGILFLDEINAAAPSVSAAAYQLILDRRLGSYQVPEGWAIFAAGNRQGDRGVTYAMPAPLANRFSHYEVDVNVDDWVAWANRCGIDERLIGFLRRGAESDRVSIAALLGVRASRAAQVRASSRADRRRPAGLRRRGRRGRVPCVHREPREAAGPGRDRGRRRRAGAR